MVAYILFYRYENGVWPRQSGQRIHRYTPQCRLRYLGDTDFVLGKFTPDELTDFQSKVQATLYDLIHDFAAGQLAITSHKHE
jgi:hypothetical protein